MQMECQTVIGSLGTVRSGPALFCISLITYYVYDTAIISNLEQDGEVAEWWVANSVEIGQTEVV